MRIAAFVALIVVVGGSRAQAAWAERVARGLDQRPLDVEAVAHLTVEAHRAGRGEALALLARREEPDVSLVADHLRARNEVDAAEALARLAPRSDREGLVAWVRRGPQTSDAALAELEARLVRMKRRGRPPAEAWRAVQEAQALVQANCLRAIRVHLFGAEALAAQRRFAEEASVEFDAAARRAHALGHTGLETSARGQAMVAYGHLARHAVEGERAQALVDLQRRRGHARDLPKALGALGTSLRRARRFPEAITAHEEELRLRLASPVPADIRPALRGSRPPLHRDP